ncbi:MULTISPECIES: hypothetical protein [Entomomonas]|uniref:Uncharacterized protein n=1 Tax=Entomomonas asaccharolytica TaxID=2785331 RepID=A0A974RY17_9GAMM|nr:MULTISPECIES: hypothetical protein [Entomomonas]QQP86823.1 hypothetical protein JHT90_06170 [Entomomonas asaccharolytica]UYZ83559.1 hypothetical protein MTZ49_13285 [Entomomonas sp. E2T0]
MTNITFKCNKCNTEGTEDLNDWEFDQDFDSDCDMGPSINYWVSIDTKCPKCGNSINITLIQTEYPIGADGELEVDSSTGCYDIK